jgi:N-acyl-D-amino-acid deacylase
MAFDLLLTDAAVVDGTGRPRYIGDIGVTDGKITEIGRLAGSAAKRQIDVTGLVAAPGVIDIHTHYDAQICWDPALSSSAEHGTTTVVTGNCGVGIAPCRPGDRELTLQDLVVLEGLSFDVMSAGIDWEFETYPEYLGMLQRRGMGVNITPLVPLSTLRRYRMGEAALERAATAEERAAIATDLRQAMRAGGAGFSASLVRRQVGYKGRPLACQLADMDELRDYAKVLGELKVGLIQVNVLDKAAYLTDRAIATLELLLDASGRTVTYSGALFRGDDPGAIERMLQKAEPLRRRGAIPQTTTRPMTAEFDMRSPFFFADLDAFKKLLNISIEEQKRTYRDPAWRQEATAALATGGSMAGPGWINSIVVRIPDERLRPLMLKSIKELAEQRGQPPLDTLLDLSIETDLKLKFLGALYNTNPGHLRRHITDPRVLLGLGDGGAHVDMLFESGFPTYVLGYWVRDEQAITLEDAVKRMTSEPADYLGLPDRGRLTTGNAADLMIFDPATVGSSEKADQMRHDLPGGGMRLYAAARGMEYVVVNGEVLFEHGQETGSRSGRVVSHLPQ